VWRSGFWHWGRPVRRHGKLTICYRSNSRGAKEMLTSRRPAVHRRDRESINTLYLGRAGGWTRIGAEAPQDKPDVLGYGKTSAQQRQFLFGEEPSVIHDAAAGPITSWRLCTAGTVSAAAGLATAFSTGMPTVTCWGCSINGSRVQKRPRSTPISRHTGPGCPRLQRPQHPDVEAFELEQVCDPQSALRSFPEANGVVSQRAKSCTGTATNSTSRR
jgi:hypothetical protein